MHASLHRLKGTSGLSEEFTRSADQLARALSGRDGFVSFALIEVSEHAGIAIVVFETRSELAAADLFLGAWVAKHLRAWPCDPNPLATGEVVVQKGM